jgi:hypothetical protein
MEERPAPPLSRLEVPVLSLEIAPAARVLGPVGRLPTHVLKAASMTYIR